MMPFVGSGMIHEANRVSGKPGTIANTKFLGADGAAKNQNSI